LIVDVGYPRDPDQVRLLPGAAAALRHLQENGFALVMISNQSGIGRGLVLPQEAEQVHARTVALLAEAGVRLDAVRYCPHAPEAGCACRKPSPAMVRSAAQELHLDLSASFFVGDKAIDVQAGQRAGCRTILLVPRSFSPEPTATALATVAVGSGLNERTDVAIPECIEADFVARDWPEVVRWIMNHGKPVE
jgi:histidinol-phosphate phosphatase family protein